MKKPFGYIYITTNKLNGNRYIGQHKINYHYKNDNYIGSGTRLWRAIRKYGIENFEKTILEECYTQKQLNTRERYWIKFYNAQKDPTFYNIAEGGQFGDVWQGLSEQKKKEISKKARERNLKRDYSSYSAKFSGSKNPCYGKHWYKDEINHKQYYLYEDDPLIQKLSLVRGMFRSEEHNKKIGISNKGIHHNSPSSGKVCVHKNNKNTYINKEDIQKYLDAGWILGGKSNAPTCLNKVLVRKDGKSKYIEYSNIPLYLKNGFQLSKNFVRKHKEFLKDLEK